MKYAIMHRSTHTGYNWERLILTADSEEAARQYIEDHFPATAQEDIICQPFDSIPADSLQYWEDAEEAQETPAQEAQEAQEAQQIKINGNATFPAPHTFWSNSPRLILNPGAIPEPIDTARNPHIAMMLRYQAEELMSSVFSDWYDAILSRDEIENDAFFTDNSLNLNNGDGYQIADNLFIDHIFAVSLYDSPRGVVAVYDSDCDDFSYWLIY